MPQLNPRPWFTYLMFLWMYLIFFPPKILTYLSPRTFKPKSTNISCFLWPWPWH